MRPATVLLGLFSAAMVTATTVSMLTMLASATIGDWVMIGLAERFLLVTEVLLVALLAWGAWRAEEAVDSTDDSRSEKLSAAM